MDTLKLKRTTDDQTIVHYSNGFFLINNTHAGSGVGTYSVVLTSEEARKLVAFIMENIGSKK